MPQQLCTKVLNPWHGCLGLSMSAMCIEVIVSVWNIWLIRFRPNFRNGQRHPKRPDFSSASIHDPEAEEVAAGLQRQLLLARHASVQRSHVGVSLKGCV